MLFKIDNIKNKIERNLKHIILSILGAILLVLFFLIPAPHVRVLNIQNYLITVSGIMSAFVIAYLSAKLFNEKNERAKRQKKIDKLGRRLTAFRQLLYFIVKSPNFWIRGNDINSFKDKYQTLNSNNVQFVEDEQSKTFWNNENEISKDTVQLHLAMIAIYDREAKGIDVWAYDDLIREKYTIIQLATYYYPTNQIWQILGGRNRINLFKESGINILAHDQIAILFPKIDSNLKGKVFTIEILKDIGGNFHDVTLPKMMKLVRANTGIPKSLFQTILSLFYIMFFGVISPLIIQSIDLPDITDTTFTLTFVGFTILSIINFLFEFLHLIDDELHLNRKKVVENKKRNSQSI